MNLEQAIQSRASSINPTASIPTPATIEAVESFCAANNINLADFFCNDLFRNIKE